MPECPTCGKEYDDHGPLNKHRNMSSDHYVPWQDKEKLTELYVDKGLSIHGVSDRLNTGSCTISRWLKRHDIEIRDDGTDKLEERMRNSPSCRYFHEATGYVYLSSADDTTLEHRLIAVAKYGLDAVKDMDVHHKNGVPWDNRPDNIELMSKSDHAKMHREEREIDELGRFC